MDLLDDETDVREILENRLSPLPRGYIGVVNRGSKASDGNMSIAEVLHAEKMFFKKLLLFFFILLVEVIQ